MTTLNELKEHCEKMIEMYGNHVTSNAYLEHSMALDLINEHENRARHDSELLDKVAEIFPKSFCTYCNQEVCEGGMVGTIQECETIRMIKDVINGVIKDIKAEVE